MSSGGISYDCLTTSRKATLPSVESWGTNMNILKDPNKGIFTRRKDRVGDTQEVLLAQDASGDRIAECINVYARGVNPMVSVSYNNFGNNAGTKSRFSGLSAHLPYKPDRIIPPMYRQEDLMPLSRQPRNWFYTFTNPELPNIIQEMKCPEGKSAIQSKKRNITIPGNKQYIKELPQDSAEPIAPIRESFHAENVQTLQSDNSRGSFHDKIETNNAKVNQNKLIYNTLTNKKAPYQKPARASVNVEKNIRSNLLHQMVQTKKSDGQQTNAFGDTNASRIQDRQLLQYVNDGNKANPGVFLNPLSNNDAENSSAVVDDRLHASAQTNKMNDVKYLPQFSAMDRKSIRDDPLQGSVQTQRYSSNTEKMGEMSKEINRNIILEPLQYSHTLHKNMPGSENVILDSSNIPTKQTLCIPVKSAASQNIYKNVTPIDLSSIPTKDLVKTSVESFKSPGEKTVWIGERPERDARVLHSECKTGSSLTESKEFYDLQSTDHNSTHQKNIDRGGFDPRPQAVSTVVRDHLDKSKDSSIDYRYSSLKNNVQDQFNQRYFDEN